MQRIIAIFLSVLGIASILYCLGISLCGFGTFFFLIWAVIGIALLGLSYLLLKPTLWLAIPLWIKIAVGSIVCIGIIVLGIVEGLILSQFRAKPTEPAQYCIILGAQWKKSGPSRVLKYRLDKAVEYLEINPEVKVIVSGGQGYNEPIAEADGMCAYLENAGISKDRIIVENQSSNTYENLIFSEQFLDKTEGQVVIVTNNFHMYRAMKIAQKQGYEKVQGLAAKSVVGFLPNNLFREFVGVMKDWVFGNL